MGDFIMGVKLFIRAVLDNTSK